MPRKDYENMFNLIQDEFKLHLQAYSACPHHVVKPLELGMREDGRANLVVAYKMSFKWHPELREWSHCIRAEIPCTSFCHC